MSDKLTLTTLNPNYDGYVESVYDPSCDAQSYFRYVESFYDINCQDVTSAYLIYDYGILDFSIPYIHPAATVLAISLRLYVKSYLISTAVGVVRMTQKAQDFVNDTTGNAALIAAIDAASQYADFDATKLDLVTVPGYYTIPLATRPSDRAVKDLMSHPSWFSVGLRSQSGLNGGLIEIENVENASNKPELILTVGSRRIYGA